MAGKFLKHKWQKTLATVLLIFIFLITVVAYFVNRYWSPILAAEVRSTVLASTDSLYQADFTDANLHIVQGKLVIFNLTLKPDTNVYNRRKKLGLAPNNLVSLTVKRVVFRHIRPLKLYYHNKLDIGQIILSAPELKINYQLNHKHDTTVKNQLTAWQRIKPMFKSIHIGEVLLNDVKFTYNDYSGNKLDISELKEINLLGKDLLIDSATQHDASRFYNFKDVQIELNNFARPSDNGLYQYKIKQLQYSTLTSQLLAYGVALTPGPDTAFFNRKVRTWFSFNADSLQLNHFDILKYNKYRLFNASNLSLRRSNLVVYANPGAQPRKSNRLLTFPHVAIHQLKSNFTIDTVEMQHLNITYKGYGKKSHRQGTVSFNNTNGYMFNLTNNDSALKKNNIARIQLNSRLMDSGLLLAEFTFNLTDSAKSYSYKGSVEPMELGKLNKAVMPFGLVKITSGELDKLSFDIKANRNVSKGNVTFLYHDLKVHILKMDTLADQYRHVGMASLFANALIVKDNNPDYVGAIPRTFNVTYVRQPDTAFFKTIWKTLSIGIKASAGYDEAMEKQVKQHIAQRRADKEKRRIKKAQRALKQRRGLSKRLN